MGTDIKEVGDATKGVGGDGAAFVEADGVDTGSVVGVIADFYIT